MSQYQARYEVLGQVAQRLEDLIAEYLKGVDHVDRIYARAKTPERFVAKAVKKAADGKLKYEAPLRQIQDQIGARVIVFYKADVDAVAEILERYFRASERKDVVPDSQWEFGYFGRHWIFVVPGDVIPDGAEAHDIPTFFELQVKTLFQHAWSEAEHDLGYKALRKLSQSQARRFAFTSAQAWGADMIFEALRNEILD